MKDKEKRYTSLQKKSKDTTTICDIHNTVFPPNMEPHLLEVHIVWLNKGCMLAFTILLPGHFWSNNKRNVDQHHINHVLTENVSPFSWKLN